MRPLPPNVLARETRDGWALTFPVATTRERRQLRTLSAVLIVTAALVAFGTGSLILAGVLAMTAFLVVVITGAITAARDRGATLEITARHIEAHGIRVPIRAIRRFETTAGHHGTLVAHTTVGPIVLVRYPSTRDPEGVDGEALLAWLEPLVGPMLLDAERRRGDADLVPDVLHDLR